MAIATPLPRNWSLKEEGVSHHGFINREFPRVVYSHDTKNLLIRTNRVQDPNKFGGWGFLVWTVGEHSEELGIVEEFDDAKELAIEFMQEYGSAE